MRIKKIEFENFRNYRDRGSISFPTDGRISVLYGPNGVGKTTMHQFFQWVLYGETHFNKTTSKEMYNLDYEKTVSLGREFSVFGSIEFEHPGKNNTVEEYCLRRKWVYLKELKSSKVISQTCTLQKKVGDDWGTYLSNPEKAIEAILPHGLSQYYFFDGESMIADLGTTGRESAKFLRKALYRLFDLDVYENAIIHLGDQNQTSSVLGKLYSEFSKQATDTKIVMQRRTYESILKKCQQIEAEVAAKRKAISEKEDEVRFLSERIGLATSRKDLQRLRDTEKTHIKTYEDSVAKEKRAFGKTVMSNFPYLLISRIVEEAQLRIGLKVEDQKLPKGLTKELIETLLTEEMCLCGHAITEDERVALEKWLAMFPPLSYKYIYDQFKHSTNRWAREYDQADFAKHFDEIFKYRDAIDKARDNIHEIDTTLKQGNNVDHWIEQRAEAEKILRDLRNQLSKLEQDLGVQRKFVVQEKGKLDKLLAENNVAVELQAQMEVMADVKRYFEQMKLLATSEYSQKLQESIQTLLDQMLAGTRRVSVSQSFELSVKDSYGKEDKSEGQFAITSFAYIGGICDLLRKIPSLSDKEFPLVLDGPFSKLDAYHRQNVIDTIPAYAPQVILFSKDDIHDCFESSDSICEWTIYSNDDRNISRVDSGYDPEVFRVNADHI